MKKRIKIIPSKSVFCDVDDTLIKWPTKKRSFQDNPKAIKLNFLGNKMTVLPLEENIAKLKSFHKKGYEIVVWSLSSKQWAEYIVKKLNLTNYVDVCLSKPDFYIDDKDAAEFMLPDKRIYHPLL